MIRERPAIDHHGRLFMDLFLSAARRVRPAYGPVKSDLLVIEKMCRRLNGMPLALILESARVADFRVTPPGAAESVVITRLGLAGRTAAKLGVRGTYRTLDRYSNRYQPDGVPEPEEGELYPEGLPKGEEWEIRTYLHLAI